MPSTRDTLTSLGLLVLRIGVSSLMLVHGIQKIQGFANLAEVFPDPLGVGSRLSLMMAIGAEVGCSLLVLVGLATRLAVIPLMITMGVALFLVHAQDPWKVKELAATFLVVYAALLLTGPGRFSVDHCWLVKRRGHSPDPVPRS